VNYGGRFDRDCSRCVSDEHPPGDSLTHLPLTNAYRGCYCAILLSNDFFQLWSRIVRGVKYA